MRQLKITIFINEREKKRVDPLMDEMGEKDKSIIFCRIQALGRRHPGLHQSTEEE
jgi:hypothetical protein